MAKTRPLRILHCVRAPSGGAFRHVQDLSLAQEAAGHAVGIVCDAAAYGALEEEAIASLGGRLTLGVRRVPMERRVSFADLGATIDILSHLRADNIDVLHGHGAKGGAFARTIGTLLRVVGRRPLRIYCPHGGSLHFDPASAEGRVYFRLERILERMTDGLVFVSDFEKTTYESKVGVPKRPVRLVPNGLRPDEYVPIPPTADMSDLLYMGMMRDLKGPGLLIEAVKRLALRTGQTPTLRMLGEGPDRARYEAEVAAAGLSDRITFHAPRPTREALSQGRILVVPSYAESLPYVVLEAIAARIPLIATRVGGIPEIFAARADRLVPAGDADALADAIGAVLLDEAAARADALRFGEDLGSLFTVEAMAGAITDFYGDLAPPRLTAGQEEAPAGHARSVGAPGSRMPTPHRS